jgi:hypothetical protein
MIRRLNSKAQLMTVPFEPELRGTTFVQPEAVFTGCVML